MTDGTGTTVLLMWIAAALLLAGLVYWLWPRSAFASPAAGDDAPAFSLPDQHGDTQSLQAYRGRWLVLYFYPKDDTPGCTTEACQFRDAYYRIKALNAAVVGVSLDEVVSHKAFAEKYHLPFPLLADRHHEMARAYGVLTRLGPLSFASRQTFIIDPQGKIARHYRKVDAGRHADDIMSYLQQAN